MEVSSETEKFMFDDLNAKAVRVYPMKYEGTPRMSVTYDYA